MPPRGRRSLEAAEIIAMVSLPPEPTNPTTRIALRPKEAALQLGIGERKLWELTQCGKIPHFRIGRAVRYPVAGLIEWANLQASKEARR